MQRRELDNMGRGKRQPRVSDAGRVRVHSAIQERFTMNPGHVSFANAAEACCIVRTESSCLAVASMRSPSLSMGQRSSSRVSFQHAHTCAHVHSTHTAHAHTRCSPLHLLGPRERRQSHRLRSSQRRRELSPAPRLSGAFPLKSFPDSTNLRHLDP